jgi:peptidyl-prolyl cis-trans isomerase B (cyclophilin B)
MKTATLVALILAVLLCLSMTACTTPTPKPAEQPKSTAAPEPTPPTPVPPAQTTSTGQAESVVKPEVAVTGRNAQEVMNLFKETPWPPASISAEEKAFLRRAVVVLETTKGIIKIKVDPDAAPIHAANFVKLARDGFYNGVVFHRVIRGFMSQGGDPTGTGQGGPTPDYTLPAEIKLTHQAGSVAAARTGDQVNPERRSSGSQFYMCHSREGCQRLDGAYTVFGQIIQGQDVNLALNVTYNDAGPIPGAQPDKIIRAWVEMGS